MTITLWGRKNSANVQKVAWAMAELGLEWESVRIAGAFGGNDAPDYLALNPNGYVPTYQEGDFVLTESDAIVRYLARKHGAGSLSPDDERDVALADQWATWASMTLWPKFVPIFFRTITTPRAELDFSDLAEAAKAGAATIAILDKALEGRDFLVGDRLSFGDLGPAIFARRALGLPHDKIDAPNVARYVAAMEARPAFARTVGFPVGNCKEEWLEIGEEYA